MQEIGHAALAIIPSFDGFQSDLERGSSKAMLAAGASGGRSFGKEAGDKATSEMSSRISDWSKKGAAALGAGIGLAVGYGFREGIDRERIGDKVAASLGLDPKAQQQQGKVAGSLYAHAFGESYEDVANAVAATTSSLPKLQGNGEIRRASRDALNFAAVFDVDIPRAVSVASTVINSKLAPDAEAAFDLLTRSSQKVPAALREDILDAAEEYGQFFHTLGFDGPKAFEVLVEGSKQGMYGIDKAGDAIKEFTIRSTDGSKATNAAYELIGLSSDTMANKILKGGDDAQEATQKIIDGLLGIESPSTRANAAIALFGTPIEDLNVSKIPAFLESLRGTEDGLDDVKGAAGRMGDTLNDNLSTDITAMKRKLETDLVEFISKRGLPALESFSDWVKDDAGPAFRNFKDDVKPVTDAVGDLVDLFGDLPTGGKLAALGGTLAGGLVVKHKLSGIFDRGGIANPMFVVVTNPGVPGGPPGVPALPGGGPGGKPGLPGGPIVAGGAIKNFLLRWGLVGGMVAGGAYGNDNPRRDDVPVPVGKNPTYDAFRESGLTADEYIAKQQKLERDLAGITPKVEAFKDTLFLAGNTKVDPKFGTPGLKEANAAIATFIGRQIEAGRPVAPYIDTTSIERAIDVAATLNATLRNQTQIERGSDGGVNYQHGGTGGTGTNGRTSGVNFNGPITVTAHDYNDFTRQLEQRARAGQRGGRP